MKKVFLTEAQLKSMEDYLNDIPHKYARPLFDFLKPIIEPQFAEKEKPNGEEKQDEKQDSSV